MRSPDVPYDLFVAKDRFSLQSIAPKASGKMEKLFKVWVSFEATVDGRYSYGTVETYAGVTCNRDELEREDLPLESKAVRLAQKAVTDVLGLRDSVTMGTMYAPSVVPKLAPTMSDREPHVVFEYGRVWFGKRSLSPEIREKEKLLGPTANGPHILMTSSVGKSL